MRRLFILAICLLMTGCLCAQHHDRMVGNYGIAFPDSVNQPDKVTVSFKWHTQNPNKLDRSQFKLQIDDISIDDFEFTPIEKRSIKSKKTILFLWEDMKSHRGQSLFTQNVLQKFFQEADLNAKDKFDVAVFNRCSGKRGESTIKPLLQDFSSDWHLLEDAVCTYSPSLQEFSEHPMETDLYLAINEALSFLNENVSDGEKIIVLFSAGLNMKSTGAQTEMATVLDLAQRSDIPVYVISYPILGNSAELMGTLAGDTYGLSITAFSSSALQPDVARVTASIIDWYTKMSDRSYGYDYLFSFTTTQLQRDGRGHPVTLTMGNTPYQMAAPLLLPPVEKPFETWVKEHLIWIILAGILLVLVVVFLILLIHWKSKKLKKKIAANEFQQSEQIAQSKEEVERLKKERDDEKNQAAQEAERKATTDNLLRLQQIMHTKNLYPRLHCSVAGQHSISYTISKPSTSIGRNSSNDVILNDGTVSGHHAEITFDGQEFEITNKSTSYTQGIVINGQFYQKNTLKNGDMIQLGKSVIVFYL